MGLPNPEMSSDRPVEEPSSVQMSVRFEGRNIEEEVEKKTEGGNRLVSDGR